MQFLKTAKAQAAAKKQAKEAQELKEKLEKVVIENSDKVPLFYNFTTARDKTVIEHLLFRWMKMMGEKNC